MMDGRHRSAGAREVGGLDVVAGLRHGRRIARLSQRDLARRAGVSQSLIARIETRRVDPPVGLMQRLLGLCGLRWDLHLTACGATPARAKRCTEMVAESAAQRHAAGAGGRRWRENMAARESAASLVGSRLTVRERRAEVRDARLAERARQAEASAALVEADDAAMRHWLAADLRASERLLHHRSRHLAVPVVDRLPAHPAGPADDDALGLLEELSGWCSYPPVALAGTTSRAVWSPSPVRRSGADVNLLPLRGREDAVRFLTRAGATARRGGRMFDLGSVTVRLGHRPPSSTTMVRWRAARPERALPVARPEVPAGAVVERHAVRAVLQAATRDSRGRRHPPYREAWGLAGCHKWFGPSEPGALSSVHDVLDRGAQR